MHMNTLKIQLMCLYQVLSWGLSFSDLVLRTMENYIFVNMLLF
jgi:hypothetical protein